MHIDQIPMMLYTLYVYYRFKTDLVESSGDDGN